MVGCIASCVLQRLVCGDQRLPINLPSSLQPSKVDDLSLALSCADSRPSFYSHSNAPGLVMAAGNTGEYLDPAADSTCTWLSRDGGFSWEDVADYAAIYEFGDHGSILLTAHYQVSCRSRSANATVVSSTFVCVFVQACLDHACAPAAIVKVHVPTARSC